MNLNSMRLFKIIVNWTPKIWLPLAIVLLACAITILARQHLLAYLDLDLFQTSPNFQIIGGFFGIVLALIDWILISVLLFLGCQLLYNGKGVFRNFFKSTGLCHFVGEGVFRNFFKIIGLCYLVLLVTTLSHFIFIFISLPPDPTTLEFTTLPRDLTTLEYNNITGSQKRSEAITEALASLELPAQLINIIGHICFVLTLVAVVQAFFEIKWIQAFCITCISYAIHWVLNEALLSIFLHVLLFFFGESLVPSWQPGIQISP